MLARAAFVALLWVMNPAAPARVAVVGSFVQDLTFLCDAFPRPGETLVGRFHSGPGGKGSNQAVAAARAGARTAFLGAVGRDGFGAAARAFHEAEGIDCRMVEKPDLPTGTAGILVNAQGQNQIVVALAANGVLSPADVDRHADVLRDAAVVVTQLESNLEAAAHALRLARTAGARTLLNPAPMRPDFDPALLALTDLLVPNETEFAALVGRLGLRGGEPSFTEDDLAALGPAELHALCRRFGGLTLVVTLGSRGCFVSTPEGFEHLPAVAGIVPVDTTGAGDAFVGALAAALAESPGDLSRAARFANVAAALSVTRPGTAPAMARRGEIEARLGSGVR